MKLNNFNQFINESIESIEEIDTKGYVSSSDFKEEHKLLFGERINGGHKIEGGHCLSFYLKPNRTGIVALADSESWTVGYSHPKGYGKLYGVWFIKGATKDDVDRIESKLQPLIREKESKYREKERSIFPEWKDLSSSDKHMLHDQMASSGHIKKADSLTKAGEEYTKYKTFWGQQIVKGAKMSWD